MEYYQMNCKVKFNKCHFPHIPRNLQKSWREEAHNITYSEDVYNLHWNHTKSEFNVRFRRLHTIHIIDTKIWWIKSESRWKWSKQTDKDDKNDVTNKTQVSGPWKVLRWWTLTILALFKAAGGGGGALVEILITVGIKKMTLNITTKCSPKYYTRGILLKRWTR